jgi:hypothetical protein
MRLPSRLSSLLRNRLLLCFANLPQARSAPSGSIPEALVIEDGSSQLNSEPSVKLDLSTAVVLVLLGGAFAGLIIAYAQLGYRPSFAALWIALSIANRSL